jgi:hypothetical protein
MSLSTKSHERLRLFDTTVAQPRSYPCRPTKRKPPFSVEIASWVSTRSVPEEVNAGSLTSSRIVASSPWQTEAKRLNKRVPTKNFRILIFVDVPCLAEQRTLNGHRILYSLILESSQSAYAIDTPPNNDVGGRKRRAMQNTRTCGIADQASRRSGETPMLATM